MTFILPNSPKFSSARILCYTTAMTNLLLKQHSSFNNVASYLPLRKEFGEVPIAILTKLFFSVLKNVQTLYIVVCDQCSYR